MDWVVAGAPLQIMIGSSSGKLRDLPHWVPASALKRLFRVNYQRLPKEFKVMPPSPLSPWSRGTGRVALLLELSCASNDFDFVLGPPYPPGGPGGGSGLQFSVTNGALGRYRPESGGASIFLILILALSTAR